MIYFAPSCTSVLQMEKKKKILIANLTSGKPNHFSGPVVHIQEIQQNAMECAHLPLIGTSFLLKNDTLNEKEPFLFLMTFPRSSLEAINPQMEMSVDG